MQDLKYPGKPQHLRQLLLHRLQQQPFPSITSVLQHPSLRNRFYCLHLEQSKFPRLALMTPTLHGPLSVNIFFQTDDINSCGEKNDPGEQEMEMPCVSLGLADRHPNSAATVINTGKTDPWCISTKEY